MNNIDIGKAVYHFARKHVTGILAFAATVGLVATSIEAARATLKAKEVVEQKKKDREEWKKVSSIDQPEITKEEIVKDCWKIYIPTLILGAGTISCIVAANVLSSKEQKSLAAAYAFVDQGYKAYRKKIADKLGPEVDKDIANEVTIEQGQEDEFDDDKVLFYDMFADRYFDSTMHKFEEAVNYVNRELQVSSYASLNDFYRAFGIAETDEGHHLGWNDEMLSEWLGYCWLDITANPTNIGDGTVCYVISPILNPSDSYMDGDVPF